MARSSSMYSPSRRFFSYYRHSPWRSLCGCDPHPTYLEPPTPLGSLDCAKKSNHILIATTGRWWTPMLAYCHAMWRLVFRWLLTYVYANWTILECMFPKHTGRLGMLYETNRSMISSWYGNFQVEVVAMTRRWTPPINALQCAWQAPFLSDIYCGLLNKFRNFKERWKKIPQHIKCNLFHVQTTWHNIWDGDSIGSTYV